MSKEDTAWVVRAMMKPGRPFHQYRDKIKKATNDYQLSTAFGWDPLLIDKIEKKDPMRLQYYKAILIGTEKI